MSTTARQSKPLDTFSGQGAYVALALTDRQSDDGKSSVEYTEQIETISEENGISWSADEEARLVRKIDRRVMPCLFAMIVFNYLDRNALANARVQGLEKSLNMSGSEFNTVISVFFVGYISLQIPSNMILTKVRPSKYLPGCMIAWGCLSLSTAFVRSFGTLAALRFCLGIVEAPFYPGALFLLSSWYTNKELALRMSILYTGSLLSGAFGGLIAAAIELCLNNVFGLESWRWLFLIESACTIAVAICAMFTLPDYPRTTRFLTPKERGISIGRVGNVVSSSRFKEVGLFAGLQQAATDYNVWLLALVILTKTSAAAVTTFIPTLVLTFSDDRITALLLSSPPYLFAALCTLVVSYSSDRSADRAYHIIVPMVFAAIGFAVAGSTLARVERYMSLFIMLGGVYGSYNVALAWSGTIIASPATKRSAALAIINVTGNLAQIYSPYLYLSRFGPKYGLAMAANVGFCFACVGATLVLRRRLEREYLRGRVNAAENEDR